MKYPERAINGTKSSISVMYCGNGIGKVLPPYVVYRSERLWDRWCQGGPRGCRYNRTTSGWFDSFCFQDWFTSMFLPAAKEQQGLKVIIGDNLSSHLDKSIIALCENENIRFVFLPPNTTHLTQPLDVAFFRPLKSTWRAILTEWKEKTRAATTLPKEDFPKLLKKVEEKIQFRHASNLIAGFRACGIVPFNREAVLNKLSSRQSEQISNQVLNDSVLRILQQNITAPAPRRKRARRVAVEPGKSVSTEDFPDTDSTDNEDGFSSEDENAAATGSQTFQDQLAVSSLPSESANSNLTGVKTICEGEVKTGQWLLVNFAPKNSKMKAYLGQCLTITRVIDPSTRKEFEGSFLRNKSRRECDTALFVYPEKEDICDFYFENVVGVVEPPKLLRRGVLQFQVNSLEW